jgi:hypothetical protein
MPNASDVRRARLEFATNELVKKGEIKALLDPETGETVYVLTKAGRERHERESRVT